MKYSILLFTITVTMGVLMAACGGPGTAETTATKATTITCHTAYRSSVSQPIEHEEAITFSDSDAQQSITFTDLKFNAQYRTGLNDNERGLTVNVTPVGETAVITSYLYQLPLNSGPQDQFIGGHGFTGLNYVYNPNSGAELQFWCQAES